MRIGSREFDTLVSELGTRVVSDMAAEAGPVRAGVIRKRMYQAGPPRKPKTMAIVHRLKQEKLKVGGTVWNKRTGAYYCLERMSKKGNAICRRLYGEGMGSVHVFEQAELVNSAITNLAGGGV